MSMGASYRALAGLKSTIAGGLDIWLMYMKRIVFWCFRSVGLTSRRSSPAEEAHVLATRAFDPCESSQPIGDRWLETVRETTVKAPLACLAMACLSGIMGVRRQKGRSA